MTLVAMLCMSGWMLWLMGVSQHQRSLFGNVLSPVKRHLFKVIGGLFLLSALSALQTSYNASTAVAMWLMVLAPTAFFTMMLYSFSDAKVFSIITWLLVLASICFVIVIFGKTL